MDAPLKNTKPTNTLWIKRILSHPITIGLYYSSILAVAFIYDYFEESLNRDTIFAASLILLVMFAVIFGITALFFRSIRQVEIEEKINDLKNFISAQQMGWIVNDKYIRSIELGSLNTWVFTRNLVNDLDEDGEIFKSVKENLAAGRNYIYFVPDLPLSYSVIGKYRKVHKFKPQQVDFYLIPEDRFLFYTEVVAYNVHAEGQIAIEWLPFSSKVETTDDVKQQYYIQMDQDHADYLIGIGEMYRNRFAPFANSQKEELD